MFTIIGADQKEYGPASAEEIRDWIKQGRADGRTLAKSDAGEWKPLSTYAEFAGFTAATGAPPRLPGSPASSVDDNEAAVIGADPDFEISECLSRGWSLLTANFGLLIGGCTLTWLLDFVAHGIPFVGIFLGGVLTGGLYFLFLKRIRGESARAGDVLAGFRLPFVQLLLAGFLISLLTTLGWCFCVVPGLYLTTAWTFALALVIDKRLEFWTAMELSRKVVNRIWFKVLALKLIVFAPFIIIFCIVEVKITLLGWSQMSSLMTNGLPDFQKWFALMEEIGSKVQYLLLASQLVLLVNLPFATGALMYAYEALFGTRPAKAA